MAINHSLASFTLLLVIIMSLFSCSGQRPTNIGIHNARLTSCSNSPNCVSSDSTSAKHNIDAFHLNETVNEPWPTIQTTVAELPRTEIITSTSDYLHAECSSALFGFVDDLELHLKAADGVVSVRSASRLGHSDFGVNRKRIERLRDKLRKLGIIK